MESRWTLWSRTTQLSKVTLRLSSPELQTTGSSVSLCKVKHISTAPMAVMVSTSGTPHQTHHFWNLSTWPPPCHNAKLLIAFYPIFTFKRPISSEQFYLQVFVINSCLSFSAGYYSAPITIQRICIILGRCLFFKICAHIFMIFEVKLE